MPLFYFDIFDILALAPTKSDVKMPKEVKKPAEKKAIKNFGTFACEQKRLQLVNVIALEEYDWKNALEQTLLKELKNEQTMRNHYSLSINAQHLDYYDENVVIMG